MRYMLEAALQLLLLPLMFNKLPDNQDRSYTKHSLRHESIHPHGACSVLACKGSDTVTKLKSAIEKELGEQHVPVKYS